MTWLISNQTLVNWYELKRDKSNNMTWTQQRLRLFWPSAQSDQRLHCVLNGQLWAQGFFMRTAKTLIRLGGCPGWSESLLGTHSFCWFCHVAAQINTKLKPCSELASSLSLIWQLCCKQTHLFPQAPMVWGRWRKHMYFDVDKLSLKVWHFNRYYLF